MATADHALVRPMQESDLPAVGKLAGGLLRLHHQWDPARFFSVDDPETGYARFFGSQLRESHTVLLVVEVDASIAGYFYGCLEGRDWNMLLDSAGHLHDVLIAEPYRQRGLAEKIVRAGMDALRAKGANKFVAHVWVGNEASRALVKRLGFRDTMIEVMAND